jgi:hypothetical protein
MYGQWTVVMMCLVLLVLLVLKKNLGDIVAILIVVVIVRIAKPVDKHGGLHETFMGTLGNSANGRFVWHSCCSS